MIKTGPRSPVPDPRSLLLPLIIITAGVFAQEGQTAYRMLPPMVYVGDRARLVVPLPDFSGSGDITLPAAQIPSSSDIDIHRVALERRPDSYYLTIEFTAFRAGTLELPPIVLAGEIISGLEINIISILTAGETRPVLSDPAGSLAIPGTGFLVYGTLCFLMLMLLSAMWGLFWGRKYLKKWIHTWKRRWLLASMARVEKNLRKALEKGTAHRTILDMLSYEFRNFLSNFFSENCQSLTAAEFNRAVFLEDYSIEDKKFLGTFFGRCDFTRFSGKEITSHETQTILSELRAFLSAMCKVKRSPL